MAKRKERIEVFTVYDGEQDATDVFVSLIAEKYARNTKNRNAKQKDYLAKQRDICYIEDGVQKSQYPSGLCA